MNRLQTLEQAAHFTYEDEPDIYQQTVTHHLLYTTVEEFDNGMYLAPKLTFWWMPFFVIVVVHRCDGLVVRAFFDTKHAYNWAAEQT